MPRPRRGGAVGLLAPVLVVLGEGVQAELLGHPPVREAGQPPDVVVVAEPELLFPVEPLPDRPLDRAHRTDGTGGAEGSAPSPATGAVADGDHPASGLLVDLDPADVGRVGADLERGAEASSVGGRAHGELLSGQPPPERRAGGRGPDRPAPRFYYRSPGAWAVAPG